MSTALHGLAAVAVVILVAIAAGFLFDPDPILTPGVRVFALVMSMGLASLIVWGVWA